MIGSKFRHKITGRIAICNEIRDGHEYYAIVGTSETIRGWHIGSDWELIYPEPISPEPIYPAHLVKELMYLTRALCCSSKSFEITRMAQTAISKLEYYGK